MRRLGDRLGAWYTPLAIGIAVLAWLLSGQVERFLAVLVIATPCPLLIAIPVAVIGAISLSARRGIIIKNPAVLEQIDSCRTFLFDKTGTLTYGKPALTRTVCGEGFSAKRSSVSRSQSRTILEASVGCSHSRLSPPARLSPFASFARQRSAG